MVARKLLSFAAVAALTLPGLLYADETAAVSTNGPPSEHCPPPTYCPPNQCPPVRCPPGWVPVRPEHTPVPTPRTAPGQTPSETPSSQPRPAPAESQPQARMNNVDNVFQPQAGGMGSLASSLGTGTGGVTSVPNMIGDFFGTGGSSTTIIVPSSSGSSPISSHSSSFGSSFYEARKLNVVIPSPGGSVVGRQKIAENTSPIPRDRVFFNYSLFDNTPLVLGGVNVDRLTFGVEKTFNNRQGSIELRIPYAYTLDSDINPTNPNRDATEFGNINLALKHIIAQGNGCLLSAGCTVTLPTADDLRFFTPQQTAPFRAPRATQFLNIENEAVHVLPFIGGVWRKPCSGLFVQSYAQLDVDSNGNPVHFTDGTRLRHVGDLDDSTFLFVDVGVGYYIERDRYANYLTAIAPIVELHYNRSLESADEIVTANGSTIGTGADNFELMNLVLGLTLECKKDTTFTVGYGVPIVGQDDRQFDGELRVSINRFFGGSSRRVGYYR